MAEEVETIVAEMDASIVPLHGRRDTQPVSRTAHFLRPTFSGRGRPSLPPSSSSLPPKFDVSKCPLKVIFHSWRNPPDHWERWAAEMEAKHGDTWKKAGIFEAIRASRLETLRKDRPLMLSLAQRWSPDTNTFVFRWGEATLTLEDVMVRGGYSVLGPDVVVALENEEMERAEGKLQQAWYGVHKANQYLVRAGRWLESFMGSGSEVEHEAFLALWLSRFVLPQSAFVMQNTFPAAIHLARGRRLALAQAVLAAIYRDMSRLKKEIDRFAHGTGNGASKLDLWAPFQLFQVWIWERFPTVRPNPKPIRDGELPITKWIKTKKKPLKLKNFVKAFDDGAKFFQWRPYARSSENPDLYKFYAEDEMWASIDKHSDEELLSFSRFLIPCELVSLGDCVEQYLPHRVGMQFGMDQDLPCPLAWSHVIPNLSRAALDAPITSMKLYIPSRATEAGITARYSKWWPESKANSGALVKTKHVRRQKKSPVVLKVLVNGKMQKKKRGINLSVPRGWGRKGMRSKRKTKRVLNLLFDLFDFPKRKSSGVLASSARICTKDNDLSVHPGLQQNELDDSDDEDHLTVEQFMRWKKRGGMENHVESPTSGDLPLIREKSPVEDVDGIVEDVDGILEDVDGILEDETDMEGWRSAEGNAGIPSGGGDSIAESTGRKVSEMTVEDLRDRLSRAENSLWSFWHSLGR